jgi:hypothetical protein
MIRSLHALAIAGAMTAGLQAQDVKSTTTVKAEDGKTVVYAGCVQPAETGGSYLLNNVLPVKETKTETTINRAGLPETKTTTTVSYVLVPTDRIDFAASVGRKVEVTAIEIPRGDDRTTIETRTKTEIKGQPTQEIEVKEKVPQKDLPQLRVVSVRQLNDRC